MHLGNFSQGIYTVDIPELGEPFRGKVRDNWVIQKDGKDIRIIVTTDRQSAFVRNACTIPGKGQISNLISAFWFAMTQDIIPNHLIAIPHPNVTIAQQAVAVIPVEVVLRRYLAKGSTPTSLYFNYFNAGRRNIYGIDFPEGLLPNQELPMGTILTPTTKAKDGHDKEMTCEEARSLVDAQFGYGTWGAVADAAYRIFERARVHCLQRGLILSDTKMEFGIDVDGNVMLIDELLTPDGSRFWVAEGYEERFNREENLKFDKDVLVRYLKGKGFEGNGEVPDIDQAVIDGMLEAYSGPYEMITGVSLPRPESDPLAIHNAVLQYFKYDAS